MQFFHLRHIVSFIARIESFDETSLNLLQHHCQSLFRLSIIYDLGKPSPSLWVICKAVPYHARMTLADYGFGLGVNSMEGREQKHQSIKKYSHNTTVQNRWPLIFRHEYIQLVHLRENGYDDVKYIHVRKVTFLKLRKIHVWNVFWLEKREKMFFFCDSEVIKRI